MTTVDPATEARAVAGETAEAYREAFGDRLIAAYLLGSLAYGGYAPAVSDIDVAVVLAGTEDGDHVLVDATNERLRARSPLHRKVSVFWSSLPALREGRDDGRFPPLDRLQLTQHGVVLLGTDVLGEVARPTAGELMLSSARFALELLATDEVIAEFHQPRRLLTETVLFTKGVLFPVRFLYSGTQPTHRAANNTEAITWYLFQDEAPATELVRLAARVRAGEPLEPVAAERELKAGLSPLYRHYIADQLGRLDSAGAPAELVTAFEDWRDRLP